MAQDKWKIDAHDLGLRGEAWRRMHLQDDRQQGSTQAQMEAAPRDAIYVWVNGALGYPIALARSLGRTDLEIVSPAWITPNRLCGLNRVVCVDHACWLPGEKYDQLRAYEQRQEAHRKARDGTN